MQPEYGLETPLFSTTPSSSALPISYPFPTAYPQFTLSWVCQPVSLSHVLYCSNPISYIIFLVISSFCHLFLNPPFLSEGLPHVPYKLFLQSFQFCFSRGRLFQWFSLLGSATVPLGQSAGWFCLLGVSFKKIEASSFTGLIYLRSHLLPSLTFFQARLFLGRSASDYYPGEGWEGAFPGVPGGQAHSCPEFPWLH